MVQVLRLIEVYCKVIFSDANWFTVSFEMVNIINSVLTSRNETDVSKTYSKSNPLVSSSNNEAE